MGFRGGSSAATRGSLAKKKEAAVVFEALGEWRAKEGLEWEEREVVKLLSQKREGEGACTGIATAAVRSRSVGAQVGEEKGVASAREPRRGEARAVLRLGATRGGEAQQEVARGGRKRRVAVQQ
jgi:hypothetical protein